MAKSEGEIALDALKKLRDEFSRDDGLTAASATLAMDRAIHAVVVALSAHRAETPKRWVVCRNCNGSGWDYNHLDEKVRCPDCGGSGKVSE